MLNTCEPIIGTYWYILVINSQNIKGQSKKIFPPRNIVIDMYIIYLTVIRLQRYYYPPHKWDRKVKLFNDITLFSRSVDVIVVGRKLNLFCLFHLTPRRCVLAS